MLQSSANMHSSKAERVADRCHADYLWSCRATTPVSAQEVGQQATSHETKLTSLKTVLCFKQQGLYFVFQTRNTSLLYLCFGELHVPAAML